MSTHKTITLPKAIMLELLDGDAVIENNIIDNTRWSIVHQIIFKYEDKLYQTHYSVGATEYQDESPWEYDDEVTCIEVEPKPVTTIQYVPVDSSTLPE